MKKLLVANLITLSACCFANQTLADGLTIAFEINSSQNCEANNDDMIERVIEVLSEAGHTVQMVSGGDINSAEEIDRFDVVLFGAGRFECGWDFDRFDDAIAGYVRRGGGVVVTGWMAYYAADNTEGQHFPGIESVLPVHRGTQYTTGGRVDALGGHPITLGIEGFDVQLYTSLGGGLRDGATPLLQHDTNVAGAAWAFEDGRSVYLAPVYLAAWQHYQNAHLLDGSSPDALRLFVQAIEWAGRYEAP